MQLYDPSQDIVHKMVYSGNNIQPTKFEEGVDIIDRYMQWLQENQLIKKEQYLVHEFKRFDYAGCAAGWSLEMELELL